MEVLGLTLGVVGLVPLFKVCVQMFDILDSSANYGTDYEILSIKLGFERVRLKMWGENLGLTTDVDGDNWDARAISQLDRRFEDRRIRSAVADILRCMKQILENSRSLQQRYGLKPTSQVPESQASASNNTQGGQNTLKATYKKAFDRFNEAALENQKNILFKASAKWAIVDKKKFELLIEDLRDFNDSLSALFPDVDDQTRENMAADIRASDDVHSLRCIETAAAGVYDNLSEVASTRLRNIGQGQVNSRENSQADDTTSSILLRPIDVEQLAKQVDRLEVQNRRKIRGMLNVSLHHSFGSKYWVHTGWHDLESDEYLVEKDKNLEFVKPPYASWRLQHSSKKKDQFDPDFSDLDPEADWKYHGRIPGTITAEGFAAEFSTWDKVNTPKKPQLVGFSRHRLPERTTSELVQRIRELQLEHGIPWGWTDKELWKVTKRFFGDPGNAWGKPEYEYEMGNQTMMLLSMLERPDIFDNLMIGNSIGRFANGLGQFGATNFFLQIILAYETLIRMRRFDSGVVADISRAVVAMTAADRWIQGVRIVQPDKDKDYVEYHSLVHESQVEGLIRFAEALDWPALAEMREYIEDAYVQLRKGGKISLALWDWMFGLVLPGRRFILKIMVALIAATPSLKETIGEAKYAISSVVIQGCSFWRCKYVVGKVMAGLPGVKSVAGWIGPCPAPEGFTSGWVRIRARSVGFGIPEQRNSLDNTVEATQGSTSRDVTQTPLSTRLSSAWVRSIGEPNNWKVIQELPRASDSVLLVSLRLQKLQPEVGVSPESTPDPSSEDVEYRASIVIKINGDLATFVLYSNPTFITAHHCIDGPHPLHERDLPMLQNLCTVGDLKKKRHKGEGVLIINATCEGGELVARAWCAENGQHAVISRGSGTCYACAVKLASNDGLGVNCLIWT